MMPFAPSASTNYETGAVAIEHRGWRPAQRLPMHKVPAEDVDTDVLTGARIDAT